jgi:heme A synthase
MKEYIVSPLSPDQILTLSMVATAAIVLMWLCFWVIVARQKEKAISVLRSNSFFRTITVIGVIAATTVLSLGGRVEGQLTAAILSGIVGYVLGSHSIKDREYSKNTTERPSLDEKQP